MLNRLIQEAEKALGIPAETIVKEGLKKFFSSLMEENNKIISALKEKYGVAGYLELEEKIRNSSVPEHSAWEDVIRWEELIRHNNKLQELIARLESDRKEAPSAKWREEISKPGKKVAAMIEGYTALSEKNKKEAEDGLPAQLCGELQPIKES